MKCYELNNSPVIKDLRFNKIISKDFLANLKSGEHVFAGEQSLPKMSWGHGLSVSIFQNGR